MLLGWVVALITKLNTEMCGFDRLFPQGFLRSLFDLAVGPMSHYHDDPRSNEVLNKIFTCFESVGPSMPMAISQLLDFAV